MRNESHKEFTFTGTNYKRELSDYIDVLYGMVKSEETSVAEAVTIVQELTDAYVEQVGKRPEGTALERLGTILMHDVLTDATPWKTQNTEYPVESDRQIKDYYSGLGGEVPEDQLGSDGKNYRLPVRRKRTWHEDTVINRKVLRSMNKERRTRRREFKRGIIQGVLTVKIAEEGER